MGSLRRRRGNLARHPHRRGGGADLPVDRVAQAPRDPDDGLRCGASVAPFGSDAATAATPLRRRVTVLWPAGHAHRWSLPQQRRAEIPIAWLRSSAAQFNLGLLKCSVEGPPQDSDRQLARLQQTSTDNVMSTLMRRVGTRELNYTGQGASRCITHELMGVDAGARRVRWHAYESATDTAVSMTPATSAKIEALTLATIASGTRCPVVINIRNTSSGSDKRAFVTWRATYNT